MCVWMINSGQALFSTVKNDVIQFTDLSGRVSLVACFIKWDALGVWGTKGFPPNDNNSKKKAVICRIRMPGHKIPSALICCPVPALHCFPVDVDFYPFKAVTVQPKTLRH